MVEVGPQDFDVLEADGQAQQGVSDAALCAFFGVHEPVGQGPGCSISVSTEPRLTSWSLPTTA